MGARVHHVKAGKDYPDQGIKKGEMHYTWSLFRQKAQRSKTHPRRSQLEGSEFKSRLYELVDTTLADCTCSEDLEGLAGEVRELGEEQRSKVDDLPENFQNGEQADRLNSRADELDSWADEIDSAASELGTLEDWSADRASEEDARDPGGEEGSTHESDAEGYLAAVKEKIEELEQSAPDPE